MANSILIVGESGTGKSTSIRNLNINETFIIKVIEKPLPFRNSYSKLKKDEETKEISGNVYVSDDYKKINEIILYFNNKRPEIKNIVIDDFQYIMANEFMLNAKVKGYEKFTELAQHSWEIMKTIQRCRDDLNIFILTHSDVDESGKSKAKTIGKMFNDKVTFEGWFTIVLHTLIQDGRYVFLTQNDGVHISKSPLEMFENKLIENDLQFVKTKIDEYYTNSVPLLEEKNATL